MHIMTKITLGVGAVMLIGSIVALVAGGGSFMGDLVENPTGTEKWTGTSPTTYEGNFGVMGIYYVFVEEGKTVDVELIGGDADSRFIPCEEHNDCEYYEWAGYTYVGDISVMTEGTWEVKFTGDGDVMIREQTIDLGGAMAFGLGFWGLCCSVCVLGLGVIFIFVLKDPPQQMGVMMVQPGQIPGQPIAGQAGVVQEQIQPGVPVGGAIHPAFEQQQPQTGQPPSQGF